jgi:glycosyltransferase involved in cell wall biosynthesis
VLVSVALVSMVRDEADNIPRLADSVLGLVDSYVFLDTGSQDNTIDVIKKEFHGLPGHINETQWVDFSTNRNQLLDLAKNQADWLLLLDADHTAEWHEALPEWLNEQTDPGFMVPVKEPGLKWHMPYLVAGDRDWAYKGSTHEVLTPLPQMRPLLGLTINHHADGAHRPEKFERDLGLLLKEIEIDPTDPRPVFYLAQTMRDMGRTEEAIERYRQRAAMEDTWEPERWYAQYQASLLRGDWTGLVDAFNARPTRAEPLRAIAIWANQLADRIPQPDDLFVEPQAYRGW